MAIMFELIFFVLNVIRLINCDQTSIIIDAKAPTTDFRHFWESTGLCPPDPKEEIYKFLLGDDERFNLALIGALPNRGIKRVRIHWLFDLIFVNLDGYDFKYLDQLFDFLVAHDLKPQFELMGSPINKKSTFVGKLSEKNITFDGNFWRSLVEIIVRRYIARFGAAEVSSWPFELWNEPDLAAYNLLNFTLADYLSYANGCAEGLRDAFGGGEEAAARMGGPAGLFRDTDHPLCWGLLEACLGNSRCPVQFISFHRKGGGTAEGVLNGTLELLDLLHNKFPDLLAEMPIANDESDIIVTWSNGWEWRGDARYAAMAVKVIADHYKSVALDRKLQIETLSYDNAFLNYHPFYFTQRTLLARFQMNRTDPPHSQFIKKPIYATMGMLSFLGDSWIEPEISEEDRDVLLTVLGTRRKEAEVEGDQSNIGILVAYSDGDEINIETIKSVRLEVNNLSIGMRFVVYLVDNVHTNPYAFWKGLGGPVFPDRIVREQMREREGPFRLTAPTQITSENISITLNLTLPSVVLVHICSKPPSSPGQVTKLSIFNVTRNEVLLTWSDAQIDTKCVRTYEVEFESLCSNSLQFVRVNPHDVIFLSYHHATTGDGACETTIGRYRIRAMDYWDQPGIYSEIVPFP